MKLIFSANPYTIHKVLAVAHEARQMDALELVPEDPFESDTPIWSHNPLGTHPILMTDDGTDLWSGMLACEYLASLSVDCRLFPSGADRWSALNLAVLGEGLHDATSRMRVAGRPPEGERDVEYLMRQRKKILAVIDQLEADVLVFGGQEFNIGHICCVDALAYLDLRNPVADQQIVKNDEQYHWRETAPKLAKWLDEIILRPCFAFQQPHLKKIESKHNK